MQCPWGGITATVGTVTRPICNGPPGESLPPEFSCPRDTFPIVYEDLSLTVCVAEIGNPDSKMAYQAAATQCAATYGASLCSHRELILLCGKGYSPQRGAFLGGFDGMTSLAISESSEDPCTDLPVSVDARRDQLNWAYCCRTLDGVVTPL